MFHSLIPSKNVQIFKTVKCKTFFISKEWKIDPCLCTKTIFSCWPFLGMFFDHSSLNQIRLVTNHVLSITHFHSCFFLTFPFKFYFYIKLKLSIKDYLLLIYTFMCMLIFLKIIIQSFQSNRILSAGFGMAWNRYGLSCT